ncbi:MAG TPA: GatB/YqeY domain-containing protein [Nitrospirota bacterium]|jgi:hypothetical protein
MSLKERLSTEYKEAMKARDEIKVSTLRMIISSVKNKEIDSRSELDDEGILAVLTTAAKQRREAIEQYEKGGRQDLADKEKAEMVIIQTFMPTQLGRDEIIALIKESATESGAESSKEMGKLMKVLMPKVKGKADGKLVNELVKEVLG